MMNGQHPNFVTIKEWTLKTGISRAKTYELLGAGDLQGRKVGTRTLINFAHGLAWLESQPSPRIRLPFGSTVRKSSTVRG